MRAPSDIAFVLQLGVLPLNKLLISRQNRVKLASPVNREAYALRNQSTLVGVVLSHVKWVNKLL